MLRLLVIVLLAALSVACHSHGRANEHMHRHSFDDLVASFDHPSRDAWQKPDVVLKHLGPLKNRTVFEIGAGTGYFTFRLAAAEAYVIAGDVDERFLDLIEKRRQERGISTQRLRTRKIPYDSPNLKQAEADVVFTVNTYHHIENRIPYFAEVRTGLKQTGGCVFLYFMNVHRAWGRVCSFRIEADRVADELKRSGFSKVNVDQSSLPYQYIVTAYP